MVWVSLVQPCLPCRTNACKLHCGLWGWEHVPRVLTPHKHPPQELLFEEFTPTTLIQFVNLYHTQTDIKIWSNVSTQWRLNLTKPSRPHSFIIHVTVTAEAVQLFLENRNETLTFLRRPNLWQIGEIIAKEISICFDTSNINCCPISNISVFSLSLENKHKPFTLMTLFLFNHRK